jgi:hypothetical protein
MLPCLPAAALPCPALPCPAAPAPAAYDDAQSKSYMLPQRQKVQSIAHGSATVAPTLVILASHN